jgi:hypothetical protein
MRKSGLFFFLLNLLFLVNSCQKNETVSPVNDYLYFPLNQNSYWIYEVDSIFYNDFTSTIDTFQYQIREFVESNLDSALATKTVRAEHTRRNTANEQWTLERAFSMTLSKERAERFENNIRTVKLVFPFREALRWNGNAYNSNDPQDYRMTDIHKSATLNGISYDSTVTVVQIDFENLIERKKYVEIYARNVGLVSREIIDLKTQVDGTIINGFIVSQRLREF